MISERKKIREAVEKGYNQSLEQVVYCTYGYGNWAITGACISCHLVNYGTDCRGNEMEEVD
jgi:hypothetical protein